MITIEDINKMIAEETEKLNAIGIEVRPVKTVKLVKATSFFADINPELGVLRVSVYFLKASALEVRETIMHELVHAIKGVPNGHGKEWKYYACVVNSHYPQYNISRLGNQLADGVKEYDLRAAKGVTSSAPQRIHKVRCTDCGRTWTRYRESRLTLHPEYYHCSCGGSIERLF